MGKKEGESKGLWLSTVCTTVSESEEKQRIAYPTDVSQCLSELPSSFVSAQSPLDGLIRNLHNTIMPTNNYRE